MSQPRWIVLASTSPLRPSLLAAAGPALEVRPAGIDEAARPQEEPVHVVRRLAVAKAEVVAHTLGDPEAVVIAADTTVERDGCILAAPSTTPASLSDRRHLVHIWARACARVSRAARRVPTPSRAGPLASLATWTASSSGSPERCSAS